MVLAVVVVVMVFVVVVFAVVTFFSVVVAAVVFAVVFPSVVSADAVVVVSVLSPVVVVVFASVVPAVVPSALVEETVVFCVDAKVVVLSSLPEDEHEHSRIEAIRDIAIALRVFFIKIFLSRVFSIIANIIKKIYCIFNNSAKKYNFP